MDGVHNTASLISYIKLYVSDNNPSTDSAKTLKNTFVPASKFGIAESEIHKLSELLDIWIVAEFDWVDHSTNTLLKSLSDSIVEITNWSIPSFGWVSVGLLEIAVVRIDGKFSLPSSEYSHNPLPQVAALNVFDP